MIDLLFLDVFRLVYLFLWVGLSFMLFFLLLSMIIAILYCFEIGSWYRSLLLLRGEGLRFTILGSS